MLNVVANAEKNYIRTSMLIPSDFMASNTVLVLESEVEVQTRTKARICQKYQVQMENSAPFVGYLDVKRHIPIYMDFPGARTEIFLESDYGENPGSKYTDPEAEPEEEG